MRRLGAVVIAAMLGVGGLLAGTQAHAYRATAAGPQLTTAIDAAAALPSAGKRGELVNDEVVVAQLDPRGLPIRAQLISRLSSSPGRTRTVQDPTATANVAYLNQRGRPTVKGNAIEVQVGGPDGSVTLTEGLVDKPLPLAMHAEYRLDDAVVDPEAVVGATGRMVVRYTVTNTDVERERITYTDANGREYSQKQPVFAPFVGTLTATLPQSAQVVGTPDALVSTDKDGNTVLTWQLLLYPPMGNYQQTVSFTADLTDGAVPGVMLTVAPAGASQDPAAAFTTDLFTQTTDGNEQLASGLEQLNNSTAQLADGTVQLASGIRQLADGSAQLSTQFASDFVPGVQALAIGATGILQGQTAITSGLDQTATGAQALGTGTEGLATGLTALADGLDQLAVSGMPQLSSGATTIRDGAAALAGAVGSPTDPPLPAPTPSLPSGPTPIPTPSGSPVFPTPTPTPTKTPTLVQAVTAATTGAELLADQTVILNNNLVRLASDLTGAVEDSGDVGDDAQTAAQSAAQLYAQVCPGTLSAQQCQQLALVRDAAQDAASGSQDLTADLGQAAVDLGAEAVRAYLIAYGAHGLHEALTLIHAGVVQVATALRSGDTKQPGLVEGLDALVAGLDQATAGTEALSKGATQAASGAVKVNGGVSQLATGLGKLADGSQQLQTGTQQFAAGTEQLVFGSTQVSAALALLTAGADQAASGTAQLATGANQLQQQGTQRIYESVVKSSSQPGLATAYLKAADARASTALPYGLPKGATGSAAYVMTMDPVAPSSSGVWQLGAIVIVLLAAGVGAVLKTLAASRH